jgi:hypothetical protein
LLTFFAIFSQFEESASVQAGGKLRISVKKLVQLKASLKNGYLSNQFYKKNPDISLFGFKAIFITAPRSVQENYNGKSLLTEDEKGLSYLRLG